MINQPFIPAGFFLRKKVREYRYNGGMLNDISKQARLVDSPSAFQNMLADFKEHRPPGGGYGIQQPVCLCRTGVPDPVLHGYRQTTWLIPLAGIDLGGLKTGLRGFQRIEKDLPRRGVRHPVPEARLRL